MKVAGFLNNQKRGHSLKTIDKFISKFRVFCFSSAARKA